MKLLFELNWKIVYVAEFCNFLSHEWTVQNIFSSETLEKFLIFLDQKENEFIEIIN
jgi:hypothetical protein